ncbi:MAG: hypothetical protein ACRCXY_02255 [Fusobacteriaceae bacterium]
MKKILTMVFLLSCLTTVLYSQEISEKEGRKLLENIRREIQAEEKAKEAEEKAKQKAREEEEKLKIAAKKYEEEKQQKIMENIRKNMNESLEEKVFRSDNTTKDRIEAAGKAFEIGKERITPLKMEEEEIIKLEKALGIEKDENRIFLSQEFDEIYNKFKTSNNKVELLLLENKKLNERLTRLDRMEQELKARN